VESEMIGLWIKAIARFPKNIKRAEKYLAEKQTADQSRLNQRPIVLDLHTPTLLFDSGRHPLCLAQNARLAGSPTYLRCSRLLLGEFARKQFGRLFLSDPAVTWLGPGEPIPDDSLVLTDAAKPSAGGGCLQLLVGRDIVDDAAVMPYPMHPTTLATLDRCDLTGLRSRRKQIGLLFAGRQDPRYGNRRIEREFGVCNRLAILDTVRAHCADRGLRSTAIGPADDAIAIIDSRTHCIQSSDWLPTLATAEFFLCCPGAAQPMCHNVIEAMSVGAIPLLEYADRFAEHLQDGVNAICFRGLDGLQAAVDRIACLSPGQRRRLRCNVVDFYEKHLRGDQFLADLRDGAIEPSEGLISMPFNDKNFFRGRDFRASKQAA
jgi:hypothetical protein